MGRVLVFARCQQLLDRHAGSRRRRNVQVRANASVRGVPSSAYNVDGTDGRMGEVRARGTVVGGD